MILSQQVLIPAFIGGFTGIAIGVLIIFLFLCRRG